MPEGEIWEFIRIAGASFFGVFLAGWFFLSLLRYNKRELLDGANPEGGGWLILQMIGPLLFLFAGFYAWGFLS